MSRAPPAHRFVRRRGGRRPRRARHDRRRRPRPRVRARPRCATANRLGPADRRRPEPSDRHVPSRDVDRGRAVDAATPAGRRQHDGRCPIARTAVVAAPSRTRQGGRGDPPRRPARPARQRRPPPLSAPPTRPANRTGPSCGVSRTLGQDSLPAIPGRAARSTSTSTPGRRSASRPASRRSSSRSSTTASTSATPTSPREPGRTPARSGGGKETNGVDDDGNGYVDDVHGWDFCHDDNTVHDFDDDFHGTHVAGTIAASLDGDGVVGVAPGVSIMALKFIGDDPDCGLDSMAIAAIEYAKSFGVQIVNASWGGRGRPADALRAARRDRATPGCSSWPPRATSGDDNDTRPAADACRPRSTCRTSCRWRPIDNYGRARLRSRTTAATTVDIAAPGEGILSSLPADSALPAAGWGWLDGTSMAAPHVTGIAALIASACPVARRPTRPRSRRASWRPASRFVRPTG